MTDMFLFLQLGWQNTWKQKTIWLFSTLPILNQLLDIFLVKPKSNSILLNLLFLAYSFLSIILLYYSVIGVPYLAYCFSTGKSVTIQETLFAIRIFFWRTIGCSCLSLIILSPIFFLAFTSIDRSVKPIHYSNEAYLMFHLLVVLDALEIFALCGFFAKDFGIWQSLKDAWGLFTSHFGALTILGLITGLLTWFCSVTAGILTLLIQSGLDITSLSKFNYFDPSMFLSKNVLFVIINGAGLIILSVFSSSVFVLAYLKYSGTKVARTAAK